jgi:hypothetical protein
MIKDGAGSENINVGFSQFQSYVNHPQRADVVPIDRNVVDGRAPSGDDSGDTGSPPADRFSDGGPSRHVI